MIEEQREREAYKDRPIFATTQEVKSSEDKSLQVK